MPSCGVCPSVGLFVTFVDHVKTNKHIFDIFSPSGSHTILVFPYQTGCRYSDGTPLTGASNAGGVGKTRFWTNIAAYTAYRSTVLSTVRVANCKKNKAATNGRERRALTRRPSSVVRCSHKTTTKCLWRARRYTPETKGGQPPGHNPRFLLP